MVSVCIGDPGEPELLLYVSRVYDWPGLIGKSIVPERRR